MTSFLKPVILAAVCAITLAACKPSADKTAPGSQKPATSSAAANTLLPSFSGEYATLPVPQPTAQGSKIEVLEFFGYFCPHCKTFDPVIHEWAKKNAGKVVFKRVPVAFNDDMIPQQRMFYALEAMGKLDDLHGKLFAAVQDERRALGSEAEIVDFVTKNGVDKDKFKELYNSPAIQEQAKKAYAMQDSYLIKSVPNVAIDGRFLTSAEYASKRPGTELTEAGVQKAMLQVMDELVATSIKDRPAAKK